MNAGDKTTELPPLNRESLGRDLRPKAIGRFLIRGCLGTGMSHVYRAWDPELERDVALKVLHQALRPNTASPATQATRVDRSWIKQEAKRMVTLKVPGVATVYECGSALAQFEPAPSEMATGELDYMAYELIEGQTLGDWYAAKRPSHRVLATMMLEITEILQHVHRAGIYHRDIKPANLLVDQQGKAYLIDFGLAIRGSDPRAAEIAGTLPYMSPEQATGQTQQIDGRSDLYSLGVTLYRLLTGRLPFVSDQQTVAGRQRLLQTIQQHPPQPPRELDASIPEPLAEMCLKLLKKNPAHRFPTAADLAQSLREFLGLSSVRQEKALFLLQTHDAPWADSEQGLLQNHFRVHLGNVSTGELPPVVSVDPEAFTSAAAIRTLIAGVIVQLRAAKSQQEVIHLVPRVSIVCGFALGVAMDHQHHCVLYHVQNARVYAIWEMDRSTKNARSPVSLSSLSNQTERSAFFHEQVIAPERKENEAGGKNASSSGSECLVVQVGANEILSSVQQWRSLHQPRTSIRCLTKQCVALDPEATDDWVRAASEIAAAIQSSPADQILLFMDGPAVLALMAGDALGRWTRKQIQLMQFCPTDGRGDIYQSVLTLPDAALQQQIIARSERSG